MEKETEACRRQPIIDKITFDPTVKSERPSITVLSQRRITDPEELRQIAELRADPEKLRAHNAQMLRSLGPQALEGLLEAISAGPAARPGG